jgi:FlaA1/EpsC-like NDP-sugar epimerase
MTTVDRDLAATAFGGWNVVVTGAGGTIGSAVCAAAAPHASVLRLVSHTEPSLHGILRRLVEDDRTQAVVEPILGSVTDRAVMMGAMRDADVVVHCAAYKHVPLCERNVVRAIRNNVYGTYVASMVAELQGVSRFVLVSTDKAVRPVSVMGATKRLAEMIVLEGGRAGFRVARMVNVLDSSGSVLPTWRSQLAAGRKITVTDPACVRYFMTTAHAVRTIVAAVTAPDAGVYAPVVGQTMLGDLARTVLWETLGGTVPDPDAHMEIVGLRPGERAAEEDVTGGLPCLMAGIDVLRLVRDPALAIEGPSMSALARLVDAVEREDAAAAQLHLFGALGARCPR